jgi:hypothetical protein
MLHLIVVKLFFDQYLRRIGCQFKALEVAMFDILLIILIIPSYDIFL